MPVSTEQRVTGLDKATGLKNLQLLIQLRWIAVIGQVATIALVQFGYGIALPLAPLLLVLTALVAFNIVSLIRLRTGRSVSAPELFVALLVDVATLTLQLYLTGGAGNPFVFLYLLQVTLAAVLLQPGWIWAMLGVTCGCFAALTLFARPLPVPLDAGGGLTSPYMQGLLVCFALNAALLATFVTRVERNLRERDARLAGLRQRAAEEEHIVRMGLLASGAAHELGTPLSTLAVILGDWQHLPHFSSDPELLDDVVEMQAQVLRCKAIVSGILLSAGEARSEFSVETTVRTFLTELAAEWRRSRPVQDFTYEDRIDDDLPMVSDSTLRQMIFNVLDNALDASAQQVRLSATRVGDSLVLQVTDAGPGFAPAVLARFGAPYNSTKGRPGGGLGLFLVVNVARTLGGSVRTRNLLPAGAQVTITLPLAAIVLADEDEEEHVADA